MRQITNLSWQKRAIFNFETQIGKFFASFILIKPIYPPFTASFSSEFVFKIRLSDSLTSHWAGESDLRANTNSSSEQLEFHCVATTSTYSDGYYLSLLHI